MTDWVTPVSAATTALGTFALAGIAWYQLTELRKQLSAQAAQLKVLGDREKQWRTIEACERYTYDPVLRDAKQAIWAARDQGRKQYIDDALSVRRDVVVLLNYLDAIGVGVQQGVYIEQIVRDHLHVLIVETVCRFVKDEWGEFDIDESKMNGLMHLYEKFSRSEVSHRATP